MGIQARHCQTEANFPHQAHKALSMDSLQQSDFVSDAQ